MTFASNRSIRRLLVVVPNWVGDVVMASPVFAALRAHFSGARIGFLMRRYVAEIIAGGEWHDEEFFWPQGRGMATQTGVWKLARDIRSAAFDAAVLLTNSFHSALLVWLAGVPRRVGYARDGRSALLTDRLRPIRRNGEYVPTPILTYYAALAETMGCRVEDYSLRLGITREQESAGATLATHYGLTAGKYAIINPGAAFGASKCWLPARFAELCDRIVQEMELMPVIVGAPHEATLMREIAGQARERIVCCDDPGTTLGSLKPLVRDAALLVCNDTGPRHYGIAFGVPTVTIFGPTHQEWTDTGYARETKLQAKVPCGPCQLKRCPLDLRCMHEMSTAAVYAAAAKLIARSAAC